MNTAYEKSVDIAHTLTDKVNEMELGHKLLEAKDKTVDVLNKTKEVVVHKGQEVSVSYEILKYLAIGNSAIFKRKGF